MLLVGLGLRAANADALLAEAQPSCSLLEVHSENYFRAGGEPAALLRRAGEGHALSLHGIGLSLGSVGELDASHLDALSELSRRVCPTLVSEHLCWNAAPDGRHFSDLLPLPRDRNTIGLLSSRIRQVQDRLQRPILVEHLAAYASSVDDVIDEPEWLNEIALHSGCGLLIDLHNLAVAAHNLGFDAREWLLRIAPRHVGQYHLAGGQCRRFGGVTLRLDSHDAVPDAEVWSLYEMALARFGARPTIVEWDADLPPLDAQLAVVRQARAALQACAGGIRMIPGHAPADGGALPMDRPQPLLLRSRQQAWIAAIDGGPDANPPTGWAVAEGGAPERFAIHRRNHQHHLLAAVEATYPILGRLLGEECLRMLAWSHVHRHALRSGNLLDYGHGMAQLLGEAQEFAAWPWLPDVARLEWALHRVAHAPPAGELLTLPALAALPATTLPSLCVRPIPATCVVRSRWDLVSIWESQRQATAQAPPINAGPMQVLLARPGLQTTMRRLGSGVASWWEALADVQFGEAQARALAADPDFDLAVTLAWAVPAGLLGWQTPAQ